MADQKLTEVDMCGYDEMTGEPHYFKHPQGAPLPKGMVDHPSKVKKAKDTK
jgi:hypothetical protein